MTAWRSRCSAGTSPHYKKVGKALKDNGLACTTCTVMPDEQHNPISAEPKNRQGAVDYLKWVIDCNKALGSEVLCGPFYQPLGKFSGKGPTQEEKQRAAEVHRKAADYAQKAGVVAGHRVSQPLRVLLPQHAR